MASSDEWVTVYECGSCGDRRLGPAEPACCDGSMTEVDPEIPIESPDVEGVMSDVFGISPTELSVCNHLVAEGEATIEELAAAIDRDRSVVTRHLNHLTELGIVSKESRVLPRGGRMNVYAHCSAEVLRRRLELGLSQWTREAVELIDDVSEEKAAMMADERDQRSDGDESLRARVQERNAFSASWE